VIAIVSHSTDLHARAVRRELRLLGERAEFLDVADLGAGDHLTFREGERRAAVWTRATGEEIDLAAASTIWHRRIAAPRLPADAGERDFAAAQWHTLLLGILQALPVRVVNPPLADRFFEKPFQLALARGLGLRVPETVITSVPATARGFATGRRGDVVHKPLTGSPTRMLATRRWDAASEAALDALPLAPVIFQEAVCGGRELRVTIVGDETFAVEFRPGAGVVDGRCDLETEYRRHALPASVEEGLRGLMERLGLSYATLDLKLTDDGEYVFLELNPQGQFLYVEILTGLPIAAAMARLLVTRAGEVANR
jgi:glutathione synthase/RimK-type ligase-like ATP-grasp enzyme